MFFTSCLVAASTTSELNTVLTKYANNPKGWSALNYAIEEGDITAAIILVDHVRDFNRIDDRFNPLCRVFKNPYAKKRKLSAEEKILIDAILEKGANVKWEETGDQLPLTFAVYVGDKNIVIKLINKGANINEGNGSPIRGAIFHTPNSVKTVKILLEKGANPNIVRSDGKSLLDEVLDSKQANRDTIVDLLIQYGTKVS